ncbi:MAG: T9SS type A sorting domain-containing protein [Saprospiraceae bacterium]|nr:T9SS type A sorting domain-containing protein [Saprospiraceae bacterium]
MNRLALSLLILALQLPAFSQSVYHPMLVEGRNWDVFVRPAEFPICTYEQASHYYLGPDTLLNGTLYKPLVLQAIRSNPPAPFCGGFYRDTSQSYSGGWLREDTLLRRVYKLEPGAVAEVLLFDFSLQSGDTLWYDHGGFAIDSVYPVTLENGEVRLAFDLDAENGLPFGINKYVEGLGYLMGAFIQVFLPFEGWSVTTCVRDGETVLYQTGPGCIGTVSGVAEQPERASIRVSPNPFSSRLQLRMNPQNEELQFSLLDVNGRILLQQPIPANTEQVELLVPNLPSGLYFWAAQGVVLGKLVSYDP